MKKRTISKLKAIFGSKKGKRQYQEPQSSKSSRTPSPEPTGAGSPVDGDSYRPLLRTPPQSRVGPPPSPPVPTQPVAPVAPEPSGPLPLMPCNVCGRTFVPESLAKHVKICEKMTIKKRKTFDSFRQRREGTDLEQYLPKNFGLPENSPFLEKSPPNTAKATPKPKCQSVRNAITKPMAELQKCPHCSRAFGVRAFERHVEWCADKAKILPAAPAQPPPHIADAKQRLNARTQYKAPPVRGRRSSQTRDKTSTSRSASVESSRAVSPPPPPREFGDYKQGRGQRTVLESTSSSNCHEEQSAHVPVIKNTRTSQNSSSGDANIKARQARLARDISSSRTNQDPNTSSVLQSNANITISSQKQANKNNPKNLNLKKQQQLKRLEEIASKHNDRFEKNKKEKNKMDKNVFNKKQCPEKSHIPVPKKLNVRKTEESYKECNAVVNKTDTFKDITSSESSKPTTNRNKLRQLKTQSEICLEESKNTNVTQEKEKKIKCKVKQNTLKLQKESTISIDSLEDCTFNSEQDNHQSIGTNTDFLCPSIPCVIHYTTNEKTCTKKTKLNMKNKKYFNEIDIDYIDEPKIVLLYKNPTIVSSCDIESKESNSKTEPDSDKDVSISSFNHSTLTLTNSEKTVCSVANTNYDSNVIERSANNILQVTGHKQNILNDQYNENSYEKNNNNLHNLSAENIEENYEHEISEEISGDSIENKYDEENNIECRHGSGETYTKFTQDPAVLDEFINLTDKMLNNQLNQEQLCMNDDLDKLHTPKTNSIESINKTSSENITFKGVEEQKQNFSDTFKELKDNLKELLENACEDNSKNVIKSEIDQVTTKVTKKRVSDMEHITVYELKYSGQKIEEQSDGNIFLPQLKLPSIEKTDKPERKIACTKKRIQQIYKPNRRYKMMGEQNRTNKEYQTFIVKENQGGSSDSHSMSSEAPPLKLPRIENKRPDDNYDPFVSAARQMKELMSSDTNIPKKIQNSPKDPSRTLPVLKPAKEKTPYRTDHTKMMKDTLNKTYQKTPTLQRMKSFGSTNNENSSSTFGGRCSSFRLTRNDKKSSQQKLNTTFTKSSKENISTVDKFNFNRKSNLNRSFSSYTASNYSTPKPKDKIPKIATSMYHGFQRTTIKQPMKLDKIKKDDDKQSFVNLDAILTDDNSSMTESHYIDPRLINENDNLPINVSTILNNPDIISSMESLLTTENLPAKFESFSAQNNNYEYNEKTESVSKIENNNNTNKNKHMTPTIDDLSTQYEKIMSSLEQSIASKASIRDDDSLCEDFDLEEFMTSFDEEIHKQKSENLRISSSTTRVVKQSELADSNRTSELNSISSSPKLMTNSSNGIINKSISLNFSNNMSENLFPSSVKRSPSLLDTIQKKPTHKPDNSKNRQKVDLLEQDIMQSLKDFDKFYETEKNENCTTKKESTNYTTQLQNGTAKRDCRVKCERKNKKHENISNGNHTPSGKASNDSAYSSLNRISPSKLSIYNTKEPNGLISLGQIPAGSDSSGSHKDEIRSVSSEEFLAMERSAELDEALPHIDLHTPYKESDNLVINDKRISSHTSSRHSPSWRPRQELSSSGSEASLQCARRDPAPGTRLSRFCHECGNRFPVETAKFCNECGVKRLVV